VAQARLALMRRRLAFVASLILGLVVSSACRRAEPSASAPAVEPPPPAAITAEADISERPFAFTAADLDAWERGMRKEIELFKAAQAKAAAAKTPGERAAAAQAGFETATAPEAARAIGADPGRYLKTRRTVDQVLETLDFQGKIPGPKELNLDLASPEMKERLSADPFAELDPASAAALRERMDRIVPIWIEYTELTAVSG
jgi:hypothetical protein